MHSRILNARIEPRTLVKLTEYCTCAISFHASRGRRFHLRLLLLAAARGHSFQLDAARPPSAAAASSSASRRSFETRSSPRRDRSSR